MFLTINRVGKISNTSSKLHGTQLSKQTNFCTTITKYSVAVVKKNSLTLLKLRKNTTVSVQACQKLSVDRELCI